VPTYFVADVAYHAAKLDRGFDRAIGLLGPDHHGYVARMQAAMTALGAPADWLEIIIVGWVPLWWIHRSKSPKASVAIGQFLLFSREDYFRMGGHVVVKDKILDDIWMGIEVARAGGRHVAVDLSSVVFCDMYPTALAMWHGLVRCIYSVVAITPLLLFVLIFFATFVYIAPFYWLWNGFFMSPTPLIWRATVISQVVLILLIRWLIDARFKAPTLSVWLHPLGISYILIIVLYAAWRWWIGAGVSWKEREYTEEETVIK